MKKFIIAMMTCVCVNAPAPSIPCETRMEIIKQTTDAIHIHSDAQSIAFMYALAMRESGAPSINRPPDPGVVNKFGYRGMFQFGCAALKDVGQPTVSATSVRRDASSWPVHKQYEAAIELAMINKRRLSSELRLVGQSVGGVTITEAGLIAGAHLVGASKVKRFIRSNGRYNPKDGFSTHLTEYLVLFAGYDDPIPTPIPAERIERAHEHLARLTVNGQWNYHHHKNN